MVHQLLVQEQRTYPLKLLNLLQGGAAAKDVLGDRPCLHDDFSRAFFKQYPAEEGTSARARATLQAILLTGSTDIVSVEWAHGRTHRLLKAQSAQTKVPSINYVTGQVLAQKYKLRLASCSLDRHVDEELRCLQDEQQGGPEEEQVDRRRAGGGGAWRAFVSEPRGSGQRPDWADLSDRHWAAKHTEDDAYATALTTGRYATVQHRALKQEQRSSFGPYTRDARRQAQSRAAGDATTQLGESAMRIVPVAGAAPDSLIPEGMVTLDVQREVGNLRSALRRRSLAKTQQEREARRRAAAEVQRQQQGVLESLQNTMPSPPESFEDVVLRSNAVMPCLQVCPTSCKEEVAVAGFALSAKHKQWRPCLEKIWSDLNLMVPAQPLEMKPDAPPVQDQRVGLCCQHGRCLCHEEGRLLLQLSRRLEATLKELLPRSTADNKSLLLDGYVCIKIEVEEHVPRAQSSWADLALEELDDEVPVKQNGPFWWHLGLMYLKPYRPTFQTLALETALPDGRMWLRQTSEYLTLVEACSLMSRSCKWRLTLLKLTSSSMPVADLDPGLCLVEELPGCSRSFWPAPPRKRRARTGRKGSGPKSRKAGHAGTTAKESDSRMADAAIPTTSLADAEEEPGENSSSESHGREGENLEDDLDEYGLGHDDEDDHEGLSDLLKTLFQPEGLSTAGPEHRAPPQEEGAAEMAEQVELEQALQEVSALQEADEQQDEVLMDPPPLPAAPTPQVP